jgi:hypothetical protein
MSTVVFLSFTRVGWYKDIINETYTDLKSAITYYFELLPDEFTQWIAGDTYESILKWNGSMVQKKTTDENMYYLVAGVQETIPCMFGCIKKKNL